MTEPEFYATVYRTTGWEHRVTIYHGRTEIEWRCVFGARAARRFARRRIALAIRRANPTRITLAKETHTGAPFRGVTMKTTPGELAEDPDGA